MDFAEILSAGKPFFIALKNDVITLATGEIVQHSFLNEIKRATPSDKKGSIVSISMVPFAQMKERGFEVYDDGAKIISMDVNETSTFSREAFFKDHTFDELLAFDGELSCNLSDDQYAHLVNDVIEKEIKQGAGANFLISRKFFGKIKDIDTRKALSIFTRLCASEVSPYMVFCFYDGEHYFISASPERHLSIQKSIAKMNPICGTLPKHPETLHDDLKQFVQDEKEINELFMVVDETLKLMMPLCPTGGEAIGPYLREMRTLVHTENELRGHTDWDLIQAFRATMFAPTMVGSPLESACRVIRRYEQEGRGHYSSALMILGNDADGVPELDSAITIRFVDIRKDGSFTVQAGASIVRDSVPQKEAIETRVKAQGMLMAITSKTPEGPVLSQVFDNEIEQLMLARNDRLSPFWVNRQSLDSNPKVFEGKSIIIINNEDDFVYMTAHILRSMGATVAVESIRNIGSNQ